jgi:hypothetical protein
MKRGNAPLELANYTEARERSLMDDGDDDAGGFHLSAYCYFPIHVANDAYNTHVNRIRRTEYREA